MSTVFCVNETIEDIKKYVCTLVKVLNDFAWLIDAYVLDFFTDNHWNKLPPLWQDALDDIHPSELSAWLKNEEQIYYKKVWPLSLQSFRVVAASLSLPRRAVNSTWPVMYFLKYTLGLKINPEDIAFWNPVNKEFHGSSGQHRNLHHIFRKQVKPKKQHEIFRLAEVTSKVFSSTGYKYAVDIGSGQGHLSRFLSLGIGLNVVSVEAEGCHVAGAKKLDDQACTELKKKQSKASNNANFEQSLEDKDAKLLLRSQWNPPQQCVYHIAANSSNEDLLMVLQKTWCASDSVTSTSHSVPPFGIIGLHTCGDLASTMLRLFTETEQAQVLLSVGCCYMKLDTGSKTSGYPMSSYVQNIPEHCLSYEAREVACHAIEMYQDKLKESSSTLSIHCYRAALEALIVKYYPHLKHTGLRSVKGAHKMSFAEYVVKALRKIDIKIPEEDVYSVTVESYLQQWKQVIVFYSLRLFLAPVIESVILLDRMLFLFEKGYPSCLVPLFDPHLSPRNHILISVKSDNFT